MDILSSSSLGRRRLCLETLKAVVEYLPTFLLVHWNTTREVSVSVVSMEFCSCLTWTRLTIVLASCPGCSHPARLLANVSDQWCICPKFYHVPGIRDREERLVAQRCHLLVPVLLCFSCCVEVSDVLLAQLGERVDDPVSLNFNTAGTVAESCRSLRSVDWH